MSELQTSLRAALLSADHPLAGCEMQAMPDKGLAHDHVRLLGSGWLARVPKQSQMGLEAEHNLRYQSACFERAAKGGHAPRLMGVLPPSDPLPRGALLVEEIQGEPAQLPQHVGAIVEALASIHSLPLPAQTARAPLLDDKDPLAGLYAEIQAQAAFLPGAKVCEPVARAIEKAIARLATLVASAARPSKHLIAFDGHPGNFLVKPDGAAVLVDLEKCRYSYPALDLAHATLYTSTTWDVEAHAVLGLNEVLEAYRVWGCAMGAGADKALSWHVPLRQAMWLWSVTWCAKWRVLSAAQLKPSPDGEDWSAQRSQSALVDHVRGRVDHYLSAQVVELVLSELTALERELRA